MLRKWYHLYINYAYITSTQIASEVMEIVNQRQLESAEYTVTISYDPS
jgi:hypothetical protein